MLELIPSIAIIYFYLHQSGYVFTLLFICEQDSYPNTIIPGTRVSDTKSTLTRSTCTGIFTSTITVLQ